LSEEVQKKKKKYTGTAPCSTETDIHHLVVLE